MKLEFIDDINQGGKFPDADPNKLVRLYNFDSLQANQLRKTIKETLIERRTDIDLATLNFIESINCCLTLTLSDADKGIVEVAPRKFVCVLTLEKYDTMIFLMEPFCEKNISGYQWLYDLDTPIDFLFSYDGAW